MADPLGDVEGRGVGRHPDRLDVHHVLDLVHHAADRRGVLVHHLRRESRSARLVGWGREGAGRASELRRPFGPKPSACTVARVWHSHPRAQRTAGCMRGRGGSEPWRSCPACRGGARRGGSRSSSWWRSASVQDGWLGHPSRVVPKDGLSTAAEVLRLAQRTHPPTAVALLRLAILAIGRSSTSLARDDRSRTVAGSGRGACNHHV